MCVNQEGARLHGFEVNTLTVIATESYEEFAENLQQEIERDTGIRFGIVDTNKFAPILGFERAEVLRKYLIEKNYIDATGQVQDSLREALKNETLSLPEEFADQYIDIIELLRKFAGRLEIKNADERCAVRPRQAILHSPEFKALWNRIKHKTIYSLAFDNEDLIEQCIKGT